MPTAEAAVCNVALIRVGNTTLLEDLAGDDATSKTCATLLPFNRDALLQARAWPFATERAQLGLTTETRAGWTYVYALPADCIAPRSVWSGVENMVEGQEAAFRLEMSAALKGRVLLTNTKDAVLMYTARVIEPPRWDPLFAETLAMKMASDLAFGIMKKPQLGLELSREYRAALSIASASAGNQQQKLEQPQSALEQARL